MMRAVLRLLVGSVLALALPMCGVAQAAPPSGSQVTIPSGPQGKLVKVGSTRALELEPPFQHESAASPIGLPYWAPGVWNLRPIGFSTDAEQAIAIAKATPTMQALHRRDHPLLFQPLLWGLQRWEVQFQYRGTIIANVLISPAGRVLHVYVGGPSTAVYARGHFGGLFDSWWVVLPFGLLFLVPFLDWRRPFRLLHLDALVLLSFGVSYFLFDHVYFTDGVLLAYPPLLYLLARCLYMGLSNRGAKASALPRLPLGVLGAGVVALVAARIALNIASPGVMDVAYASIDGAARIAHGQILYYGGGLHYDTYGPIDYLAYLPFETIIGWSGRWDSIPAAHVATLTFDLLTICGLLALGTRLRPGRTGWRLGLTLSWAWAAYPFTLLGVMKNTNDGLIVMLLVWSLVAFASPVRRGLLLALAVAAKFVPAILLPLYVAGRGERDTRSKLICAGTFVFVVAGTILLYLPPGGLSKFYNETIGFQLSRTDVFSVWSLYPSLSWLKLVVEVATVALAIGVGWARHPRSIAQVAALAGALMIAVQLPARHWFYFDIVWFAPFLLVALFARELAGPAAGGPSHRVAADDVSPALTSAVTT